MSDRKFEVTYGRAFLADVRRIPNEYQRKLAELVEILGSDPFDSRLHTKPLSPPLQGMFSFRITRDWRVGFTFSTAQGIELLVADRRDKIYQRLGRMR